MIKLFSAIFDNETSFFFKTYLKLNMKCSGTASFVIILVCFTYKRQTTQKPWYSFSWFSANFGVAALLAHHWYRPSCQGRNPDGNKESGFLTIFERPFFGNFSKDLRWFACIRYIFFCWRSYERRFWMMPILLFL